MNIVLIGFMGCGKSTVAKRLGAELGLEVLDTDELLVRKEGRSISDIFSEDGETYFRDCETDVLRELLTVNNSVVATGGGIIERAENWPLLRQIGRIIYLDLPWPELQQRIAAGQGRPLGGDGENWSPVKELWQRRLPIYRQADEIIDTQQATVEAVVDKICRRFKGD